jgi:ribosome-binding factor A
VGYQIRAEISDILLKKIRDPRVGFASLTRVELSDDLKHAGCSGVFEDMTKRTIKGLRSAVIL